jgi:hypothetical protein
VTAPKVLAFYLPQFHPTAENDGWWTPGFTEWTNVVRGKPLFEGHRQPHLPGELGFYDLRLPETRVAQAALAAEHGIDGFCDYHYRFGGRRLLERTFDEVLETGSPDFPFCLLWANETWSRRWYVGGHELLMPQVYSDEDDANHVEFLVRAFADDRYIRVEGRPLFIVYRLHEHPDPKGFATRLRRRCAETSVPDPYLVHVDVWDNEIVGPQTVGFDASMAFLPHGLGRFTPELEDKVAADGRAYRTIDYATAAAAYLARPERGWTHHHCVVPMWDNTPRKLDAGGALVLTGTSIEAYRHWLTEAMRKEAKRGDGGVVFINAWNEWAEGAHLEPDLDHGRAYLEATKAVIEEVRGPVSAVDVGAAGSPPSVERLLHHLHSRLAAMHGAESEAFASFDREVTRRTASLAAELADARAGERRLMNLLDAVLATDRPTRMGVGTAVTAYLDIVAQQAVALADAPALASLSALASAAESALGADVAGDTLSIGAGSTGAAVVLRAALNAYDRTGRRAYATDLGRNLVDTTALLARLGIDDHRAQLFSDDADVTGLAQRVDAISVLRIGAGVGAGVVDDLLKHASGGGVSVLVGAPAAVATRVAEAAQSTGVRVVVTEDANEAQSSA